MLVKEVIGMVLSLRVHAFKFNAELIAIPLAYVSGGSVKQIVFYV